jgi:hypothetical protein
VADVLQPGDFDRVDHVVASGDDIFTFRAGFYGPVAPRAVDQELGHLVGQLQAFGINVDQGECAAVQGRSGEDVGH